MQITILEYVCFHYLKHIIYCLMYDGLKTKEEPLKQDNTFMWER